MKLIPLLKHYTPILCVLLVGGSLSIITQNHISKEVEQQKLTEFEILISNFTIRLQDEILLEEMELETLSTVINTYPEIIHSKQFDRLPQQVTSATPAIEKLTIATPADNPTANTIKIPVKNPPLDDYTIIYEYPKPDKQLAENGDTISNSYHPLSITGDKDNPAYLIATVNIDTALSDILDGLIPDWLDIVIYSNNDGALTPFYYYSNTGRKLSEAPSNPLNIDSPNAIYLSLIHI